MSGALPPCDVGVVKIKVGPALNVVNNNAAICGAGNVTGSMRDEVCKIAEFHRPEHGCGTSKVHVRRQVNAGYVVLRVCKPSIRPFGEYVNMADYFDRERIAGKGFSCGLSIEVGRNGGWLYGERRQISS